MSDQVRQIQKASWSFLGLALFMLAVFFFGAPSIGPLSSGFVVWVALIGGIVAGLGAIQCVIFLRRRKLAIPNITVAAVIVGSVTLVGSVFIVAYGFLGVAN
jgi:hypothetical protein